jgi:integrase/recombinase XerC
MIALSNTPPSTADKTLLARFLDRPPCHADIYQSMIAGGLADNSKKTYGSIYEDFAAKLGLLNGLSAAQHLLTQPRGTAHAIVTGYRNLLIEEGKAPKTVNLYVSAIRSLVREANRCGLIDWVITIRGLKTKAYRNTAGPGHDNYKLMLTRVVDRIASKGGHDPKGLRDLAILRLLYDAGLRREEVSELNLEGVQGSAVMIVAKGDREASRITLAEPTMRALSNWIAARGTEPGPLFQNLDRAKQNADNGRRLSTNSIYRIVVGTAKALGIHVHPHALRHGGITRAARVTNGNAVAMRAFSRHARLDTVQIYIDNDKNLAGQVSAMVAED